MTNSRIAIDARILGSAHAGIGIYTQELVSSLLRIDKEDTFFLLTTPDIVNSLSISAPNLKRVPIKYQHYSYAEQIIFPWFLSRQNFNLVHYTNFNCPIFFKTNKSIVTIHDLTLWFFKGPHSSWLRQWAYRLAIRKSCETADKIIAISEATKQDIIQYLKIDPEKIEVIYSGISARFKVQPDAKKVEAIKSKYNITRPYFLYVGQWREHKNLTRLVRAFALFRHRYGVDYQLVIVGKITPDSQETLEVVKQLGLRDAVVATDYISDSDLPYFYQAAEAFVFPSLYEGFGIPPLEAMAMGLPVISSSASVMPEVLGTAALYFNPEEIEDIAAKLNQFAGSFRLRQELKAAGLTQVKRYSYAKTAQKTLALYKKVLLEK